MAELRAAKRAEQRLADRIVEERLVRKLQRLDVEAHAGKRRLAGGAGRERVTSPLLDLLQNVRQHPPALLLESI
eukprot:745317-Hanusia_phi.AAC.1